MYFDIEEAIIKQQSQTKIRIQINYVIEQVRDCCMCFYKIEFWLQLELKYGNYLKNYSFQSVLL